MNEPRMTGKKTCPECNEELHVLCFACDKKAKDGLRYRCRTCDGITSTNPHASRPDWYSSGVPY